jgi:serine/threonine protein kinase
MHENHVAHRYVVIALTFPFLNMVYIRDCTYGNIMLDPSNMFPESFHPAAIDRSKDFRRKAKWHSRTRRPTRYLLIDFGLSRRYDPANGPPLDIPIRGGDKTAPEHEDRATQYNPFPTDVYYLGNLAREYYMQVYAFFSPPDTPL